MTPPTDDQLTMTGESDGWRRLRDGRESATIVYVVERPRDGYERTIFFPHGHARVTMYDFEAHVRAQLEDIDPPAKWHEEMKKALGDDEAMQQVVTRINSVYSSARVGEGRA